MEYLTENWLTPAIAYTVSAIGSLLGLSFATRARRTNGLVRWQWVALAAVSLGGMAVWAMHSIAMMSFSVPGIPIRYDPVLTVASGAIAIVVIAVALVLTLGRGAMRLLTGGLTAGSGVIVMHHVGVASMNVRGNVHHDPAFIALSCVIALVAATTALWFASRLSGVGAILLASAVMATAVTAMHYTGMAGVHITELDSSPRGAPEGATATDLLLPLIVTLFVFLLVCSLFLLLGVEEERPDYSHRTVTSDPLEPPPALPVLPHGYTPRHGSSVSPLPPPSDDVWARRR